MFVMTAIYANQLNNTATKSYKYYMIHQMAHYVGYTKCAHQTSLMIYSTKHSCHQVTDRLVTCYYLIKFN